MRILQRCIEKNRHPAAPSKPAGLKPVILIIIILTLSLGAFAFEVYFPTNRDTRLPPQQAALAAEKSSEYEFLGRFGDLAYYYRSDRNIILIENEASGYAWKTGLDAPFGQDLDRAIDEARTLEEKIRIAEPREVRLNATYVALANSLLTVEYYDSAFNMNIISSAARRGASSELVKISNDHFRLDARFLDIDLLVRLHIHLSEHGITYKVYDSEIEGAGADRMAALIITPFLGAAGGVRQYFDAAAGGYGPETPVPVTGGYAFVPDGSGALIRFSENEVNLNRYIGKVYGENPAESMFYYDDNAYIVEKKEPLMPVFGVAIGHKQKAFAAWADEGAEQMEIIMSPKGNMTNYDYIYPRFVYNRQIHQVYNRKGEGFFRLYPDRLHYDISIEYRFLDGDKADYVGMALAYRDHLIENKTLIPGKVPADGIVPLRADFIMSDVKKSVIGYSNAVTTNVNEVKEIILDMIENGIGSISSGLLGFQSGGITTGKPWTFNFIRPIGTQREFKSLFEETAALASHNIDISFSQEFSVINRIQMNLPRNQAYHKNRWGVRAWDNFDEFLPVQMISYARPQRSADWFTQHVKKAAAIGAHSVTASGITSRLISHWGRNDSISASETIGLYERTFAASALPVNAVTPNQYLWKYTDRFLQAPVFSTQYILQTDTVPFLQLVLNGTMEIYAPYSNFSFYTKRDILRMIDYNVYPSFALTYKPAHLLSSTNSLKFFSTEYEVYRDIIKDVYAEVSAALGRVKGKEWLNRTVLAEGVILNEYSDDLKILINYTNNIYDYAGIKVEAQCAAVIQNERRL